MESDREEQWLALAFSCGEGAGAAGLRRAVAAALDRWSRVVRSRDGVVIVVREGAPFGEPSSLAEEVRVRVAASLDGTSVSAGVGVSRPSAAGLRVAVLQAEQALLLGRALRGEGRTTAFADLGPYCFVLGQPTRDIREFCERVLGPLASDARHQDLVRTLEAYIRSHGSVNAVARALYLHRNTVRQRLRRIAAITGADLNDADSRLALHLAILGRRALEGLAAR